MDRAGDKTVKRREGQASGLGFGFRSFFGKALNGRCGIIIGSLLFLYPFAVTAGYPGEMAFSGDDESGGFYGRPDTASRDDAGGARLGDSGKRGKQGRQEKHEDDASGDQVLAAVSRFPHKLHDAAGTLSRRLDRVAAGLRNGSTPLFNGSRVPEPEHVQDEAEPEAAFHISAGDFGLPSGDLRRGGSAEDAASHPGNPSPGGRLPGKPRIRRISGWDDPDNAF
ncbi:hypothetical protein [Succinimonas sp.]|uniref:hypothetical protein n=1 Tax=Succinimonas sp. TaxID=1936151 RepID=UPI00386785D9